MARPSPLLNLLPAVEEAVARRSDDALARLRAEILSGKRKPGATLPAERELAEHFATNRTTLREALRSLEGERLVRIRHGEETVVLDWRRAAELNLLPAWLGDSTSPLGERLAAIRDLQALRTALLVEAVGKAATHATTADLASLRAALKQITPGAGLAAMEHEVDFFRELLVATHSLVGTWVFNTFARTFAQLAKRFPSVWAITPAHVDRLGALVELIAQRKPREAEKALAALLHAGDRAAEARVAEVAVALGLLSAAEAKQLINGTTAKPTRATRRRT